MKNNLLRRLISAHNAPCGGKRGIGPGHVIQIQRKSGLHHRRDVSGIAAATARLLAREGARLALADMNEDALEALAAEFSDAAISMRVDVADPDEIQSAVERAVDQLGRIDILFNNAGIVGVGRAEP